jgi:hypothetical protein
VGVLPVSQICALMVFESTPILLVANSTPMVDFDSILIRSIHCSINTLVPEFISSEST